MDTFSEEFKDWMNKRGLTAESLSPMIGKSPGTIANWRSNGVPESDSVRTFLAEFIASYNPAPAITDEAVQSLQHGDQLTLRPTEDEFEAWNRASVKSGQTLKEWAFEGLNELAGVPKREKGNGTNG